MISTAALTMAITQLYSSSIPYDTFYSKEEIDLSIDASSL